jgi:hypothetical protein
VGSELDGKAFAEHPLIVERLRCCLQEHNRKAVGTSTRMGGLRSSLRRHSQRHTKSRKRSTSINEWFCRDVRQM